VQVPGTSAESTGRTRSQFRHRPHRKDVGKSQSTHRLYQVVPPQPGPGGALRERPDKETMKQPAGVGGGARVDGDRCALPEDEMRRRRLARFDMAHGVAATPELAASVTAAANATVASTQQQLSNPAPGGAPPRDINSTTAQLGLGLAATAIDTAAQLGALQLVSHDEASMVMRRSMVPSRYNHAAEKGVDGLPLSPNAQRRQALLDSYTTATGAAAHPQRPAAPSPKQPAAAVAAAADPRRVQTPDYADAGFGWSVSTEELLPEAVQQQQQYQ
jgi:hypothetical protein